MRWGAVQYGSPGTDGDGAVVRDDSYVLVTQRDPPSGRGLKGMGTIRYALRVRGRSSDAVMAAMQEELNVAIVPVRTVLRGWLPDQAALLGVLARARLLGLELIEVRRQPERAVAAEAAQAIRATVPPDPLDVILR